MNVRPLPFFIAIAILCAWLFIDGTKPTIVIIEPNEGSGTQTNALPANFSGPVAPATALRQTLITRAMQEVGKAYVLGAKGPNEFDCSGLMQYVYRDVTGIDISPTTFTQLDALRPIDPSNVLPADLVYFQFPWDQHVGMLADIDGDGQWDMINAAAPGLGVRVEYNVFNDRFYTDAIIGYRTAIEVR
jgi:cell wall-associated NlpC family hydrolase